MSGGEMLHTPPLISAFHSLTSLLLSKSCFQAEDVGVAGEGGTFCSRTENISVLCVLWQWASSHLTDVSGRGPQGVWEVDEITSMAWAQLPLPFS